jgi:hypothetical protein
MGGKCSTHGELRKAYTILIAKPERKRPSGRTKRKLEDNIKMDLEGIKWRV